MPGIICFENGMSRGVQFAVQTRLHKPTYIIGYDTLVHYSGFSILIVKSRSRLVPAYTPLIRLTPLIILTAHQCALYARNCSDIISPTKKLITNTASGHASYATRPRKIINDIPEMSIHSDGTRAAREKKKYESNRSFARLCVP